MATRSPSSSRCSPNGTRWVYSRRGHGGSGDARDYSFDREVEDVLAVLDAVEFAVAAGDLDVALALFLAAAGATEGEIALLRSQAPVWARARHGVRLLPRELRAWQDEGRGQLAACIPPDVPTLYLYGEQTDAPVFPTAEDVAQMFPRANVQALPGQRHFAFAFGPKSFADAIVDFTTAHDSPPQRLPARAG